MIDCKHHRRRPGVVATALFAAAVGGCASNSSSLTTSLAGNPAVLTPVERSYSCREHGEAIAITSKRMIALVAQAKSESEASPATVAALYGRYFNAKGVGLPSVEQYKREQARIDAFREFATQKGCKLPDAEKQIGDARQKYDEFLKSSKS